MKHKNITIQFANEKAAEGFAIWLCESGEQDYWNWMEVQEEDEEEGDITAISFHYHGSNEEEEIALSEDENDEGIYHLFLADGVIRTTCGRLDRKE